VPGARFVKTDECERFAQHQFGGFGGVIGGGLGFGIPAFGSTGFTALPGGGLGSVPAGGVGPVLTLEQAFGVGFTAQDIADQILVAEQEGKVTAGGIIDITTGPLGRLVLDLAVGLFQVLDPTTGARLGGGVTPEAAVAAVLAGGSAPTLGGGGVQPPTFPETLTNVTTAAFAEPPAPPPVIGSPEALAAFLALIGEVFARGDPLPGAPQPFPAVPSRPPPPARVRPGGTVNVPVVLGSTGDPTGVRRPRFPDDEVVTRTRQVAQLVRDFLALLEARRTADKQRRAFEQFLAARLELLRRAQPMPFGQAGFAATPLLTGGIGGVIGQLGADAIEGLLARLSGNLAQPTFPSLPAFPQVQGPPGMAAQLSTLGGACPPLFRAGAASMRMSPVPWFPVQAPNGKWFFFGHLGSPTFSKLKSRRRHHHHSRKR